MAEEEPTTEETPKLKWNQHAIEDDIEYVGPLSYRHLKVIGWALLVIKLIIPPLTLATKLDAGIADALALPLGIADLVTPLSVFFLLVASFSQLLVREDYKKQMLTYGLAALAIIAVFNLLYHRYIVSAVDAFVGNRDETLALCDAVFSSLSATGFLAFNVFIDLFMCVCVMFFLNYTPTKYFTGQKLKWFRYCAALPAVFEVVCLFIKLQANVGNFHIPISFFPVLPTKPPMMFFVLCAMIVYQTVLERRFCKDGRTHEEYVAYLDTRRNRWEFAKFAAIACLVGGVLDAIIGYSALASDPNGGMDAVVTIFSGQDWNVFQGVINRYFNAGFGGSMELVLFAPIMLLFNYRKTYKNTIVELAIPVAAVTVLLILYLEGALFVMGEVARYVRDELPYVISEQVTPAITQMLEEAEKEYASAANNAEVKQFLKEMGVSEEDIAAVSGSSSASAPAASTSASAASSAPAASSASTG